MKIYTATGTAVVSKQIPPEDKFSATGWFGYMQPLNSLFTAGRHFVRYTWAISSTQYVETDCFEIVAGGDDDGQILSMFYLDRPDNNDFVLSSTDQGNTNINRGPHV